MEKRLYARTWTNPWSSKIKSALISTSDMTLKWVLSSLLCLVSLNFISSYGSIQSTLTNELSQSKTWKKIHWIRMLGHSRQTSIQFSCKLDVERWGSQYSVLRDLKRKLFRGFVDIESTDCVKENQFHRAKYWLNECDHSRRTESKSSNCKAVLEEGNKKKKSFVEMKNDE